MNAKFLLLTIASISLSSFTTVSLAEEYQSIQTSNGGYVSSSSDTNHNSGYTSSGSSAGTQESNHNVERSHRPHREHKKEHNRFSIGVHIAPPVNETYVVTNASHPRIHYREPQWIGMRTGAPVPTYAVIGGGQSYPPATLFVCRAHYRGGMHPGKLYNGTCNIGWGGNEIVLSHYEVLVSPARLGWVATSFGNIPSGAIEGGYQHNGPLFICQANYRGGTHAGKVVDQNCNFGWGGREVSLPYYKVLVR